MSVILLLFVRISYLSREELFSLVPHVGERGFNEAPHTFILNCFAWLPPFFSKKLDERNMYKVTP